MPLPHITTPLAQTADGGNVFQQFGWVLLALIVVAFLAFGLRDLGRLSWTRISAISSVSFDESIRRRVLWITPLAILGAIVVSQLQNAVDPQDAIRQTTKFCLFATGLVVTLVAIILASTNLQREIETRVIYTIVTKPTTRLEIVLGKIWGFAKVSAAILLIMGVFTYAYLHVRAWRMNSAIAAQLENLPPDAVNRKTLDYYRTAGLLNAKKMAQPAWLQMLATPPVEGEPRWMAGGQGQKFQVKFKLTDDDQGVLEDALKAGGRLAFAIGIPVQVREPSALEMKTISEMNIPLRDEQGRPVNAPTPATQPAVGATTQASATQPATAPAAGDQPVGLPVPIVDMTVSNVNGEYIVQPKDLNKGAPVEIPLNPRTLQLIPLEFASLERMFEERSFNVNIVARSPAVRYGVGERPIWLQIVNRDGTPGPALEPTSESKNPMVTGINGRYGQQIYGAEPGRGGVAVYHFENAGIASAEGEDLTFEVKTGIERGGEGLDDLATLPEVELLVYNPKTNSLSEPRSFRPETNRITYVTMPRSAFPEDGKFDVLLRVLTPDQWLGVQPSSVVLATGSASFALNLLKSLLILWLMSVLVVSIALFCSTFVSWPIAVVLTLVILLGRWGVDQIGDASAVGIGAQMSGQVENTAQAKVVRTTVETLSRVLGVVSAFLPDISNFQATADIERGISVPLKRFQGAGWVLLTYGVPMVLLAYLILKRKEVAP